MPREPQVEFDHHSDAYSDDPYRACERLRSETPVAFSNHNGGYWVVSDYDYARRVLSDDQNFTVERTEGGASGGLLIPSAPHAPRMWPGELDGEEHDRLRRAINSKFTRASVERDVLPMVEQICAETLDHLRGREEFDAATEYSVVIPIETIFGYVGLAVEDKLSLITMLEAAFATDPEVGEDREEVAAEAAASFAAASEMTRSAVRRKRDIPEEDLITAMLRADPPLSEDEIVSLTLSMILGGVRTTASTLDNALWHLDGNRELRRQVVAEPSLLPSVVDEIIRIYSPTPFVARTALQDVEVGGATILAGDRVAAGICAANWDQSKFSQPLTVDTSRRAPHLAFGVGAHYCLGVWLAKLEVRVGLAKLLERMPNYEVDRSRAERYEHVGVNNGWATLPIRTNVT